MNDQPTAGNPRLEILRREIEKAVLRRFRLHSCWSATITGESDLYDCIEVAANKGPVTTQIAVFYSSATSNAKYRELSTRVEHIFFLGQAYELDSFARGVSVPVDPLGDFLPFLVSLNKQVEPDCSPPVAAHNHDSRRLTAENPLESVIARLQQFTSTKLAVKLVERRAAADGVSLSSESTINKATGVAYSMRSALDYLVSTASDKLNTRVIRLYYGAMSLAQAEMLASAHGPNDLDEVEGMTKQGHGLYTFPVTNGGFAELRVGVLATGFMFEWMRFLGENTKRYPTRKPRSPQQLDDLPAGMACSLRDLFSSMPEIDDLFAEVFGGPPSWISVIFDNEANRRIPSLNATAKKADSSYALFIDRSGEVSAEKLRDAGWPLAEIQRANDHKGAGVAFRARVDHAGWDYWWRVLPIHKSPFGKHSTLLFPTVGGHREYRTIAAVTLYALSIMARYMPSAWRRVEGGDEDQYLALVKAALAVWERVLPEQFLETIAGETVHTAQPGSFFA